MASKPSFYLALYSLYTAMYLIKQVLICKMPKSSLYFSYFLFYPSPIHIGPLYSLRLCNFYIHAAYTQVMCLYKNLEFKNERMESYLFFIQIYNFTLNFLGFFVVAFLMFASINECHLFVFKGKNIL